MFIQVIIGSVADETALSRAMDQWTAELKPGATGWLGSTTGVTEDGTAVVVARFESADAAAANSQRPEQGAWWEETAKAFDGEPDFWDSSDVTTSLDGGSDDAGFVQVIVGKTNDRAALEAIDEKTEPVLREVHTGLIGTMRGWSNSGDFVDVVYFTDETSARAGEKAIEARPELAEVGAEFGKLMQAATFYNLRSPRLDSA
jgi:hypothetical protein